MTITTTPFFNFQDFHAINKEERGGDGGSPVRRANKARRWGALLGGRKAPPALERGFLRCGQCMPGEVGTLVRTGYLSLAVVRPYAMSWTAHVLKYSSTPYLSGTPYTCAPCSVPAPDLVAQMLRFCRDYFYPASPTYPSRRLRPSDSSILLPAETSASQATSLGMDQTAPFHLVGSTDVQYIGPLPQPPVR